MSTTAINEHGGPLDPAPDSPSLSLIDVMNRGFRPSFVYALAAVGVLFLLGLMGIMLFRYAVHGEIDWQGFAAFCAMVLIPILQHNQNRSTERRAGCA